MNLPLDLEIDLPPDEPLIRFRRTVAAPPAAVFSAWTEPEQLRHWWGPSEWELVVCEVDLCIGGRYRFVHQDQDGTRYGTSGTYLRIEPARLLANTFTFDGTPDRQCVDTVEFIAIPTGTLLRGTSEHQTVADRDAHFDGGMERGMRDTQHRLDAHLSRQQPSAATDGHRPGR